MPQFIRKRRGWDWSTPAEIRHLPPDEQLRLMEMAFLVAKRRERLNLSLLLFVLLLPSLIFGLLRDQIIDVVFFHLGIVLPYWIFGVAVLIIGMAGMQFIYLLFALGERQLVHKAIRDQMLAEGIRPAVCFECRYFTEGFEGDECPNCGAALVAAKPGPPPEKTKRDLAVPEFDRLLIHLPIEVRRRLKRTARQKVRQGRSMRWARRFLRTSLFLAVFLIAASWVADSYLLWMLGMGFVVLSFLGFVPYAFRDEQIFRRHLGELMRAEGIHPRFCFACNYYVQDLEGGECPNCAAAFGDLNRVAPLTG